MKKYQDYQLYFYVSIICIIISAKFFLTNTSYENRVYFGFIQFIILQDIFDLLRGNKIAIILFIFLMYLFVFIILVYSPQKELWVPYYFSFQ